MLINKFLQQGYEILEFRGRCVGDLAFIIPQPNLDYCFKVGGLAKCCNFFFVHRAPLQVQRMDGGRGQAVKIFGVSCAKIAFGRDVMADAVHDGGWKEGFQHRRTRRIMMIIDAAIQGIVRKLVGVMPDWSAPFEWSRVNVSA